MDKVVPFLTQCTCTHARTHTHHNTEMHVCTLKAKFHYTIDSNEKQEAELSQRDRATRRSTSAVYPSHYMQTCCKNGRRWKVYDSLKLINYVLSINIYRSPM